jgi:hypothetical protein
MAHWFGGGHPSQLMSRRILEGMDSHFTATLAAVNFFFGAPLVIKNAWNCFRTEYLASALPTANFIWIRRDIRAAAKSDLAARYAVQGSGDTWNSATPANVEALRARPCWEQVVENQYEFGKAISATLQGLSSGRFVEVWYEDLVADASATLSRIAEKLDLLRGRRLNPLDDNSRVQETERQELGGTETEALDRYVYENLSKLHGYFRP